MSHKKIFSDWNGCCVAPKSPRLPCSASPSSSVHQVLLKTTKYHSHCGKISTDYKSNTSFMHLSFIFIYGVSHLREHFTLYVQNLPLCILWFLPAVGYLDFHTSRWYVAIVTYIYFSTSTFIYLFYSLFVSVLLGTFMSLTQVEFILMWYEVTFPKWFSLLSSLIYDTFNLFLLI